MKKLVKISLFSMLAFVGIALSSCNAQVPKADLKTDIDSISYAQGVLHASQIDQMFAQFGIEEANKADFIKGFTKGMKSDPDNAKIKAEKLGEIMGFQFGTLMLPNMAQQMFEDSTSTLSNNNFAAGFIAMAENPEKTLIKVDEAQTYTMTAVDKVRERSLEKNYGEVKKENAQFLEKNKSAEGVVSLPSGLQYKVITEGNGPKPKETDRVKVKYRGTNINGEEFDSSGDEAITFGLNQVVRGWTEGIQLMPVGSKYMLYIPYDMAYGAAGREPKISPYATLIFEVELLDIVE